LLYLTILGLTNIHKNLMLVSYWMQRLIEFGN
jgi:hypothetical protein